MDWSDFERKSKEEFANIPVKIYQQNNVEINHLADVKVEHGTILKITKIRSAWDRKKLKSLKASLAKLVNPFGKSDDLEIFIHAPAEIAADQKSLQSKEYAKILADIIGSDFGDESDPKLQIATHELDIINGRVQNFIFAKLSKYTTNIEVTLDSITQSIRSKLYDRGELILEIEDTNEFRELSGCSISVQIHYLNTAAKREFSRFMSQQATQFGSVFLFNNNFRVFPIGEPGDDSFGLDTRKGQGYSRYLGTREIVGQINIDSDNSNKFREASSRNSGLIKNKAYEEMVQFFYKKCISLLERYVVNVNWVDKLDRNRLDISGLNTDRAKARIIQVVSQLAKSDDVKLIYYSPNLMTIIDEKSADFSLAMQGLEQVAEKIGDADLKRELALAKERQAELIRAQKLARDEADAERKARKEAEEKARTAEEKLKSAEKKVNFFMALDTNDFDSLVSYHHHVGTYLNEVSQHIRAARLKISRSLFGAADLDVFMERVDLANTKIQSIVNFATKANFVLDGEETTADLREFIPQYIREICTAFAGSDLKLTVENTADEFELKFKPIEFFVVIDNLVHNSKKAGAKEIVFNLSSPDKKRFCLMVTDDGAAGLHSTIAEVATIFDKGVTTTSGSGLGLYHSKQLISEMGGAISAEIGEARKLTIKLEFAK